MSSPPGRTSRVPSSCGPVTSAASPRVDGPAAVDEVLRVLADLQDVLDGQPGAGFHHLYVATTTEVAARLAAGAFEAPAFICALDARFAVRYLAAVRAMAVGAEVPRSWRVVLDPREEASLLARTAAGVNAHINFDLPFALLAALRGTGVPGRGASPEYRDYLQVNEIFYALLPQALDFTVGHDGFLRLALPARRRARQRRAAHRDRPPPGLAGVREPPVADPGRRDPRAAPPGSLIDWLVAQLGAEMLGPAGHLALRRPAGRRRPGIAAVLTAAPPETHRE